MERRPLSEPRTGAADRIHAIASASPVPGIRLVGVDGPAGAGRSTLARELSTRFGWPVVEIDDFFSWTGFHNRCPRFQSQVITPLLAGQDIRYRVRDWTGDEFGDGWPAGRNCRGARPSS